jgi:hypothetical protein
VQFYKGVSVNTHKGFALEILITMAHILDEGVPSFSFCLEGVEQVVPDDIRELLGFQKGNPGTSGYAWRHIGRFLEYDHGEKLTNKEIVSGTPSSKCFTHGCVRGFWGE